MAYKVNYGLERAERNRLKQAKKEAKLRDRKAAATQAQADDESPKEEDKDARTDEARTDLEEEE